MNCHRKILFWWRTFSPRPIFSMKSIGWIWTIPWICWFCSNQFPKFRIEIFYENTLFYLCSLLALIGLCADSNKSFIPWSTDRKVQDRKPRSVDDQVRMMRMLLDMPPDRLQVIKRAIDRVEKMSPDEKELVRARLERFRKGDSLEKKNLLRHLKNRQDWLQEYWNSLYSKTRSQEMRKFLELPR